MGSDKDIEWLGDKGYQGIQEFHQKSITQQKKKKKKKLSVEQKKS